MGKTTVVVHVVERLGLPAGGFYTQEIRERGRRVGFAITTLDGRRGILAHVACDSEHRVSRYRVNVADIDGIAVPALLTAVRERPLVVVDEIARMELFSERFRQAVTDCVNSPKPLLGTIQARSDPFLDAVRQRADVRVHPVSRENRDALVAVLADTLRAVIG